MSTHRRIEFSEFELYGAYGREPIEDLLADAVSHMFKQLGRLSHLLTDDFVESGIVDRIFHSIRVHGFVNRKSRTETYSEFTASEQLLFQNTVTGVKTHVFETDVT